GQSTSVGAKVSQKCLKLARKGRNKYVGKETSDPGPANAGAGSGSAWETHRGEAYGGTSETFRRHSDRPGPDPVRPLSGNQRGCVGKRGHHDLWPVRRRGQHTGALPDDRTGGQGESGNPGSPCGHPRLRAREYLSTGTCGNPQNGACGG